MSAHRKGGKRQGAGRPPGIPNPGTGPLPVVYKFEIGSKKRTRSYSHLRIPVTRCNACGCAWVDAYIERQFDELGRTVAEIHYAASQEWHQAGCPFYAGEEEHHAA